MRPAHRFQLPPYPSKQRPALSPPISPRIPAPAMGTSRPLRGLVWAASLPIPSISPKSHPHAQFPLFASPLSKALDVCCSRLQFNSGVPNQTVSILTPPLHFLALASTSPSLELCIVNWTPTSTHTLEAVLGPK